MSIRRWVVPGLLGIVAAVGWTPGPARGQAQVTVVNMIPKANSDEEHQDAEPNLAVNPANPKQIAGSAFTPDPSGGPNAPIFVSSDGGDTWLLNAIVPSEDGDFTGDITVRFSTTGDRLYSGILRRPGNLRLNILRTDNFLGASTMTTLIDREQDDQPYVQAVTIGGKDRVYVGSNDFAARPRSATIDRSLDAATAATPAGFQTIRIEARNTGTGGQDGPPIRPAVHADGTVYGIFYGWRAATGDFNPTALITADVVVVRDDSGGAGATPFTALTDPSDGRAGRKVVIGRVIPWANVNQANFGQERFVGSNISIAVDPRSGQSGTVYVAWADRPAGTTNYDLHVRRSTNRGASWSTTDIRHIVNATNPALAVNSNGRLAFMYQKLEGTGASRRWVTKMERTNNAFATATIQTLATAPASTPFFQFRPYQGDYIHLMAVGKDFYGIFSANNTPDPANFPMGVKFQRNHNTATKALVGTDGTTPVSVSIDPFFVKVIEP